MQKSDVVTKNISNCSINSPKGGTSSVKASHCCNVKDSLSDLWSPAGDQPDCFGTVFYYREGTMMHAIMFNALSLERKP